MPAMLDDPAAPTIYRVSGAEPFPVPYGPLPDEIQVRQVTLRDRSTIATLVPFSSAAQVPPKLTSFLCDLLNREIEKGDTYPMMDPFPRSSFGPYWFQNFAAIMILDDVQDVGEVATMEAQGVDWAHKCLGSFYIKPNYPGRSSHVCNAGFLVSDAARNRGVGRLMGECYLEWAPKLGYTYSVFNLVYETNVASLRIWDALGFKRIGRVKGCGNLRSYPDQYIDAIIFGRELGAEDDEYVSEERFDKIRYYLKTGTYPAGSDRAEKSRLRSAATHYRLMPNPASEGPAADDDILMLKGKEVISDPDKQYAIARDLHAQGHGGINKTTASIAEKYHWVRIKETVSAAIRNCADCKEPAGGKTTTTQTREKRPSKASVAAAASVAANNLALQQQTQPSALQPETAHHHVIPSADDAAAADQVMRDVAAASMVSYDPVDYANMPVDPQIMMHHPWSPPPQDHHHSHQQHHHQHHQLNTHPHLTASGAATAGHHLVVDDDDGDVGARLREELAAEMLKVEQQQQQQQQQHHGGGSDVGFGGGAGHPS